MPTYAFYRCIDVRQAPREAGQKSKSSQKYTTREKKVSMFSDFECGSGFFLCVCVVGE